MLDICETCPNRFENVQEGVIVSGGAHVGVQDEGVYVYITCKTTPWVGFSQGYVNDSEGRFFPQLADSINTCDGPVAPVDVKVRRGGLLGLFGLKKTIVSQPVCPALAEHLDVRTAESVETYFAESSLT